MQLQLDTIILFVQDVERQKSFYTHILNLKIEEEIEAEWVLLKAGSAKIGLHKIGDEYLTKVKGGFKFDNNVKLVFEAKEDIHQLRKTLIHQKVKMQEVKTFEAYDFWICDGEDPEGNAFQLKQKKK